MRGEGADGQVPCQSSLTPKRDQFALLGYYNQIMLTEEIDSLMFECILYRKPTCTQIRIRQVTNYVT